MMRSTQMLILLVTLLSAAAAQQASSGDARYHATFVASNGDVIKLDTRTGILKTPRSTSTDLKDCSDKVQVCLTNNHGFSFAYFRKCNDPGLWDNTRLRFPPKVISVLHNTDVWFVFDASPNYLFHYKYSKGIVGIYIGPTESYDFRSVLRDPNFRVFDLDSVEYRIVGSDTVAACSE